MDRLKRHLIPNAGTLLILVLFFLVQSVVATPNTTPLTPQATTTLLSYQGTLTNKSGAPINGNVEMVFALYHQAMGGTPFWTESYTGTQAIAVTNGQFHVLLGSRTSLNPTDLKGDLYLGIQVNNEEMTPRETLTSVPKAIQAETLRSYPRVSIAGDTVDYSNGWPKGGWMWLRSVDDPNASIRGSVRIHIVKDLSVNNSPFFDVYRIQSDGGVSQLFKMDENGDIACNNINLQGHNLDYVGNIHGVDGKAQIHMPGGLDGNIYLNWHSGGGLYLGGGTGSVKFGVDKNGNVTCGGLVEANLQTEEERAVEHVDRFEQGDVLCWANDQLEKCGKANDPLIQAVADANGKPIVIGAEVIKVLGPVRSGDLLVASAVPGYAMVNNNPRPGTVIAQALQDFDGERGLIKAMIRKF